MPPHLSSDDQVKVARIEEGVSFTTDCHGLVVDVHMVFRDGIDEIVVPLCHRSQHLKCGFLCIKQSVTVLAARHTS